MLVRVQVPCVAVVENMSYFEADGRRYFPFGKGSGQRVVKDFGLPNLFQFPIEEHLSAAGDGESVCPRRCLAAGTLLHSPTGGPLSAAVCGQLAAVIRIGPAHLFDLWSTLTAGDSQACLSIRLRDTQRAAVVLVARQRMLQCMFVPCVLGQCCCG